METLLTTVAVFQSISNSAVSVSLLCGIVAFDINMQDSCRAHCSLSTSFYQDLKMNTGSIIHKFYNLLLFYFLFSASICLLQNAYFVAYFLMSVGSVAIPSSFLLLSDLICVQGWFIHVWVPVICLANKAVRVESVSTDPALLEQSFERDETKIGQMCS